MNLGELRSRTQTYLLNTSSDSASLSWSSSELDGYLNEGIFYTQQMTLWYEDWDNVLCTASTSTYTGPKHAYQYSRLTWDRNFLPQTNEYELDRDDPSWRQASPGTPFRFYYPQMSQNYLIAPYPTPLTSGPNYVANQEIGVVTQMYDTALNDGTFSFTSELGVVIEGPLGPNESLLAYRCDRSNNPFASAELGGLVRYTTDESNVGLAFVRIPDLLVSDSDTPQLPTQCHLAIVFYALMKCFNREGEFQDIALAQSWFSAYGDWMEAVLENKARWYSTRVKSMEPFEEGSLFAKRLMSIGYPMQIDLQPSYS